MEPAPMAPAAAPRRTLQPSGTDPTEDLMRRVFVAIDEWAEAHGMASMPKDVLLTQVASILTAMVESFGLRDDRGER